jgi:DNA adenine methylase
VCIRSGDALRVLDDYDTPECLIFVDPPYPGPVGRRYAVRMTAADHEALADRLSRAAARVILTMNPDTVYGSVLREWQATPVLVQGGGNAVKGEMIYTNFMAEGRLL